MPPPLCYRVSSTAKTVGRAFGYTVPNKEFSWEGCVEMESVVETQAEAELQPVELTHAEAITVIKCHLLGLLTLGVYPYLVYRESYKKEPFLEFHALQALLFVLPLVLSDGFAMNVVRPLNFIYIGVSFVVWALLSLVVAASANLGKWADLPIFGQLARKLLKMPTA